jgi:hypothetical protein
MTRARIGIPGGLQFQTWQLKELREKGTIAFYETQAREMWTPQTVVPVAPNPKGLELAQASYKAYGLGWVVSDFRGTQILAHGGGVPGMVVVLVIVPARQVAFAVFLNSEETNALSAMQYKLLDHYVHEPRVDGCTRRARQARVTAGRGPGGRCGRTEETRYVESEGPVCCSTPMRRHRDAWYGDADGAHRVRIAPAARPQ